MLSKVSIYIHVAYMLVIPKYGAVSTQIETGSCYYYNRCDTIVWAKGKPKF